MVLVNNFFLGIASFVSLYYIIFWILVFLENLPAPKSRRIKDYKFVSIIVPSYNEESGIIQTIKSLISLKYPKNSYEIIVVNDGSTDKTRMLVENYIKNDKPGIVKLVNQENTGKGGALNTGLKITKGEFFVCMDADSLIDKDALIKIIPHFDDEKVAIVLPRMKIINPKNFMQKMQWYEYIVNLFFKDLMGRLGVVHIAPGPFSVYRTSVLKELGGFDDQNNLTEDFEMALRIQKNHYQIMQLNDVEVRTVSPSNLKEFFIQRNRWFKGSLLNLKKHKDLIFNKKYGDFGLLQVPSVFISAILAFIVIGTTAFQIGRPLWNVSSKLYLINFDIMTLIRNITFNWAIYDLSYGMIAITMAFFMISLFVLSRSHKHSNEKILKFGLFSVATYLALYFLLVSTAWVIVGVELALGKKKQKW